MAENPDPFPLLPSATPTPPTAKADATSFTRGRGRGSRDFELAKRLLSKFTTTPESPKGINYTGGGPGLLVDIETGGSQSAIRGLKAVKNATQEGVDIARSLYRGDNVKEIAHRLRKLGSAEDVQESISKARRLRNDVESVQPVLKHPSGGGAAGRYKSGEHRALISPRITPERAKTTAVHEISHAATMGPSSGMYGGKPLKQNADVERLINRNINRSGSGILNKDYLDKTEEVQARLNEIRTNIDPDNPWREFDKKEVFKSVLDLKNKGKKSIEKLFEKAKGETTGDRAENLTNLLNKMFTAGAGTGVASQVKGKGEKDKKATGGFIRQKKNQDPMSSKASMVVPHNRYSRTTGRRRQLFLGGVTDAIGDAASATWGGIKDAGVAVGDFAKKNPRAIGTALGTVAGTFAGNPMMGARLGGMAGGAVSKATGDSTGKGLKRKKRRKKMKRQRFLNQPVPPGRRVGTPGYVGSTGSYAASGGALRVEGRGHEDGGIKIGDDVEIEGGETIERVSGSPHAFSDQLTVPGSSMEFAEMHQNIKDRGGGPEWIESLARMQNQVSGRGEEENLRRGGEVKMRKDGGKYHAIKASETSGDDPKYPINSADDVRDAWKLRNHGDYNISKEKLEQRIKRKANEYDVDLPTDNDSNAYGGAIGGKYQNGGSVPTAPLDTPKEAGPVNPFKRIGMDMTLPSYLDDPRGGKITARESFVNAPSADELPSPDQRHFPFTATNRVKNQEMLSNNAEEIRTDIPLDSERQDNRRQPRRQNAKGGSMRGVGNDQVLPMQMRDLSTLFERGGKLQDGGPPWAESMRELYSGAEEMHPAVNLPNMPFQPPEEPNPDVVEAEGQPITNNPDFSTGLASIATAGGPEAETVPGSIERDAEGGERVVGPDNPLSYLPRVQGSPSVPEGGNRLAPMIGVGAAKTPPAAPDPSTGFRTNDSGSIMDAQSMGPLPSKQASGANIQRDAEVPIGMFMPEVRGDPAHADTNEVEDSQSGSDFYNQVNVNRNPFEVFGGNTEEPAGGSTLGQPAMGSGRRWENRTGQGALAAGVGSSASSSPSGQGSTGGAGAESGDGGGGTMDSVMSGLDKAMPYLPGIANIARSFQNAEGVDIPRTTIPSTAENEARRMETDVDTGAQEASAERAVRGIMSDPNVSDARKQQAMAQLMRQRNKIQQQEENKETSLENKKRQMISRLIRQRTGRQAKMDAQRRTREAVSQKKAEAAKQNLRTSGIQQLAGARARQQAADQARNRSLMSVLAATAGSGKDVRQRTIGSILPLIQDEEMRRRLEQSMNR